jgi:hypothetical protein
MIVRQLAEGDFITIPQEGHADISAQLAAHWGNDMFARLEPYGSMMTGVTYHDSGHREMEASVPIDPKRGLPYLFRGAPPEVRVRGSDETNARWVHGKDPYAGLVVAMHHNGLHDRRRYDTVCKGPGSAAVAEGEPLGIETAFADLSDWECETARDLGLNEAGGRDQLWYNYQALQVFDIMSLYFCLDGYQGGELRPSAVGRVPLRPGSSEVVDIAIEPVGPNAVRFSPYPFDVSPFTISVMGRRMPAKAGEPAEAAQDAYHYAPRQPLTWEIRR